MGLSIPKGIGLRFIKDSHCIYNNNNYYKQFLPEVLGTNINSDYTDYSIMVTIKLLK